MIVEMEPEAFEVQLLLWGFKVSSTLCWSGPGSRCRFGLII